MKRALLLLVLAPFVMAQQFSDVAFVAALENEAGVVDSFTGTTLWVNPTTVGGAGGTGTSTNINAGASRPFFSLEDAIDTLPDPLTTPVRIFCSGGQDIEPVQQDNWNFKTTAANYLWVIGDNNTGKFDATKYYLDITNQNCWYNNNIGHGRAWNIQVRLTCSTSSGANYIGLRWSTANNENQPVAHEFRGCIVRGVVIGGATDNITGISSSDPITDDGGRVDIINCIVEGCAEGIGTDGTAWAAANVFTMNSTAVKNESGFAGLQACINCLSVSNIVDYNSTGTTGHTNNVASDTSAGGVGALDNQVVTFVDFANSDFHLHADDLGARGLGLAVPLVFTDDIDGETRTVPWDIGADKGAFTTIPTFFADTSTGETAGSATSSVLTSPASIPNNAIMIYVMYKGSSAALTLPAGEGWTEATGSPFFNSGGHYTHVLWKRSDGSEPATHTFSWTGAAFRYGHGAVFLGCTTSGSPFDQEPAAAYKTPHGSNRNYPDISITTAVANTLIFWAGDEDEQATSGTPPTGMVETEDAGGGNNPWETAIRNKTSAGSFTATGGSYGGSNVGITSAVIMSLKP